MMTYEDLKDGIARGVWGKNEAIAALHRGVILLDQYAELIGEEYSTDILDVAYKLKIHEINTKSNSFSDLIKGNYSNLEIDSWLTQQAEAQQVIAGQTLPDGKLITELAKSANTTTEAFAERIMNNVAQAEYVTVAILSQQQTYSAQVKAIRDNTELDDVQKVDTILGIKVNYTLPS